MSEENPNWSSRILSPRVLTFTCDKKFHWLSINSNFFPPYFLSKAKFWESSKFYVLKNNSLYGITDRVHGGGFCHRMNSLVYLAAVCIRNIQSLIKVIDTVSCFPCDVSLLCLTWISLLTMWNMWLTKFRDPKGLVDLLQICNIVDSPEWCVQCHLHDAVTMLAHHLANGIVDWGCIHALMASQPIVWTSVQGFFLLVLECPYNASFVKLLSWPLGWADLEDVCGVAQLCSGLWAGMEGAIHAVH